MEGWRLARRWWGTSRGNISRERARADTQTRGEGQTERGLRASGGLRAREQEQSGEVLTERVVIISAEPERAPNMMKTATNQAFSS